MTLRIVAAALALLTLRQDEAEYARKLSAARGAVAHAERELADAEEKLERTAVARRAAADRLEKASDALRSVERRVAAAENLVRASVEKIQQMIDFHQKQLDKAEAENKSETLRVALAKSVMEWTQKRDKKLRDSGLKEHLARLERLLPPAEEARDAARRAVRERIAAEEEAGRTLNAATAALDEARRRLEALLAEGERAFAHLAPPHLELVVVRSGDHVVYKAEWVSRSKDADERVKVAEAALEGLREHRRAMQELVEAWEATVTEARDNYTAATDAYVTAIKHSAFKVILVELGDAAINVLKDFKTYGPYAFAVEANARLTLVVAGKAARKFEDPVTHAGVTAPAIDGHLNAAAKSGIKSGVKTLLSATAGGEKTMWRSIPPLDWKKPQNWRAAFNDGAINQLVRKEYLWPGQSTARIQEWDRTLRSINPRTFARALVERLKAPSTYKGLFWSQVQAAAKEKLLKEWANEPRLEAWRSWMAHEAAMNQALQMFRLFVFQRNAADAALAGLHEALEEARKAVADAAGHCRLHVSVDEVLEGPGTFNLYLKFTNHVEISKLEIGGRTVEGAASGAEYLGRFTIAGMPDPARLRVDAIDKSSRKRLDDPSTEARHDPTSGRWSGYEPREDAHHRFKLKPLKEGNTILFLVDCSGSMDENGRLDAAKAAVRRALASPALGPDDEFGLMVFSGGSIRTVVPFTQDRESLLEAVNGLSADGDTPLAEAIRRAGRYLQDGPRTAGRILIVLSDGQDTCDGDPQAAAEEVRRRGVEVRR